MRSSLNNIFYISRNTQELMCRFVLYIGNSASGVARNCDFLADAISTVNSRTRVLCVLDGPSDFTPFWIQDIMTNKSDTCGKTEKQIVEDTKFLWGRRDDESCVQKLKDDLNSTSLAEYCGIFSR